MRWSKSLWKRYTNIFNIHDQYETGCQELGIMVLTNGNFIYILLFVYKHYVLWCNVCSILMKMMLMMMMYTMKDFFSQIIDYTSLLKNSKTNEWVRLWISNFVVWKLKSEQQTNNSNSPMSFKLHMKTIWITMLRQPNYVSEWFCDMHSVKHLLKGQKYAKIPQKCAVTTWDAWKASIASNGQNSISDWNW